MLCKCYISYKWNKPDIVMFSKPDIVSVLAQSITNDLLNNC